MALSGAPARLAYGLLGLPLAFAALPVYVHVPRFYAASAGMGLAALGAILLAARLLDALIDPAIGWLADRVPRKRMILLALVPLLCGFVALFHPPQSGRIAWLGGALALTYLGYSAATVGHQAWGADLGCNAEERTRLTGAREMFGLLGVILAAALPALLADNLAQGLARLGWILPPMAVLAALIAFAGAGEGMPALRPQRETIWSSLRLALEDSRFSRLLLVFAINGIAAALPATLFLFFVADVLQLERWSGPLLALYFIAGAASVPFWVAMASRIGRSAAWLSGMVLAMAAFASAGLLGPGDRLPFAAICLLSGLALGADVCLPAALAADFGERQGRVGACFGLWNFIAKLNLALAAGIVLPLLGWMGYRPGEGAGQGALIFAYALMPLVFKWLAFVLLWRWRHVLEDANETVDDNGHAGVRHGRL